jgi:hypothetical protein
MWEECLMSLASRYKDNGLVAGMDLRLYYSQNINS